ncbi:Glutamate receptor ionotropic, kainate 2 [Nymphon striatum]|nr:Glutamate receptor ionotropic, kainate 2 [Nymphon striatum]
MYYGLEIFFFTPNEWSIPLNFFCKMLNLGVAAVFGPHTNDLSQAVGSVLDSFDVPHFEARWDARRRNKDYTFNLFPDLQTVVQAYKDVLKAKNWKKYAILYEDNEEKLIVFSLNNFQVYNYHYYYMVSLYLYRIFVKYHINLIESNAALLELKAILALIRMQWLLQTSSTRHNKDIMRLRKLTHPYRNTLREIKLLGIDNILLDCKTENIQKILKQAQQVGLMNDHNSYIITNLDFYTVNMEDFMHSQTNITGFRILNPHSDKVQSVLANFREYRERRVRKPKPFIDIKRKAMRSYYFLKCVDVKSGNDVTDMCTSCFHRSVMFIQQSHSVETI